MKDAPPDAPGANPDATAWADVCAVLVLDVSGHVVAANRSARELWGVTDKAIVQLQLASLFAPDAASVADEADAQWHALRATALDTWARLTAYPQNGSAREVRVRVERAFGGAGTYIATIQPRA